MEVYVTIVRYKDPYQTILEDAWFDEKTARNRCKRPLRYLGESYEVESYELYGVKLIAPLEVGGNPEKTDMEESNNAERKV